MKRALVLSLICVLGLGIAGTAQTLSGYWDTMVNIDPTGPTISIDSDIYVAYTVGAWTFFSLTEIEDAAWVTQEFGVTGVLGLFTDLTTSFSFDPVAVEFLSWTSSAEMRLGGVTFGFDFHLTPHQTYGMTSGLDISVAGKMGDVDINIELGLGSGDGCDFDFRDFLAEATVPFCCDLSITGGFYLSCENGFEYMSFATTFGGYKVEVQFDLVDGKTVEFAKLPTTPEGFTGCARIIMEDTDAVGYWIDCEIGNVHVTLEHFEGEGALVTARGAYLYGYQVLPKYINDGYFEAYRIRTRDSGCCEGAGDFIYNLIILFADGATLFDVGAIDAFFSIGLAPQFALQMGLFIDVAGSAFTEWSIGFKVTW